MGAARCWFLLLIFFGISANPGADKPSLQKVQVNDPIKCSTYHRFNHSASANSNSLSADVVDDQPDISLELAAAGNSPSKRILILNGKKHLKMDCYWDKDEYRCQWSPYYYVVFQVEGSVLQKSNEIAWNTFQARWVEGAETKSLYCGQRSL